MLRSIRTSVLILGVCFLVSSLTFAQKKTEDEPRPDVPLAQWLAGPDRTDFPAEFKVLKPRLTYQQRFLVETRASISGEIARGRELHIWLKVADHSGKWLDGEDYVRNDAAASLTKDNEVQFDGGFYAQPGQYTVAVAIYDAKSKQLDLRHMPLTVEPIKSDPLARHIEAEGDAVEFLTDAPPGGRTFQHLSDVSKNEPDSLWQLAKAVDSIRLNTSRPLQIDVVLNFSDLGETNSPVDQPSMFEDRRYGRQDRRFPPPPPPPAATQQQRQREYVGALLSSAMVLANIHPSNGCVRISGIDITDMSSAFPRTAPEKMDWDAIRRERTTSKLAEVSVNALQNRKEQPIFLRDALVGLKTPIADCGTGTAKPQHAVIFVSHSFVFPSGAHKENFKLPDTRLYYFQLNIGLRGSYDDLNSYLKSADAHVFGITEPRQLREALAHTLSDYWGK